jgi:hypothetical protein
MTLEDIDFPVYRKYKNNKSYFKIINPRLFEEVQIIGAGKLLRVTEARLFPEILFIQDLLLDYADRADEISEQDYLQVRP